LEQAHRMRMQAIVDVQFLGLAMPTAQLPTAAPTPPPVGLAQNARARRALSALR
jgi:hypothetical protein